MGRVDYLVRLRMVQWQLLWRSFLDRPWAHLHYDAEFDLYEVFAGVGPLQMRFTGYREKIATAKKEGE